MKTNENMMNPFFEGIEKSFTHCAMGAPIREAGKSRQLGLRPHVRGSAKNACDHAHGGGEGRSAHTKLPEVLECPMADDFFSLIFLYGDVLWEDLGSQYVILNSCKLKLLETNWVVVKGLKGRKSTSSFFSLVSQVAHWSRPPQDEVGQALTSELYIGNLTKNET